MPTIRFAISSQRDPGALLEALREPVGLFEGLPGVVGARLYRELGICQLSITYRRFLTTYVDTIHFTVSREGDRVVYSSLEPEKLAASFRAYRELGTTVLEVEISYEPPGGGEAAMRAIEGIFRMAIERAEKRAEEIEKTAPRAEAPEPQKIAPREAEIEVKAPAQQAPQKGAGEATAGGATCTTCLLYEPEVKICTYFAKKVEDPSKPICGGEKYIKAT